MGKKQAADQVNIWYSPHIDKWVVCCLIVKGKLLRREKMQCRSLEEALQLASDRYKSRTKL